MSDSFLPHGLQHARILCHPFSPRVCSNSYPLSQWCYLSHPLVPLHLRFSVFPSIRIFSNESVLCIRWPKYWSFSFSINPSSEYSGLISFRVNWFDLLAVQVIFKSLLKPHSLKASVFQCLTFFMVQFSHTYMTTGKKIKHNLTIGTSVGIWEMITHCSFDLHFSNNECCWASFHVYVFFGDMSV